MGRLIDRDEALLLITDLPVNSTDAETVQRCVEVISNMPTVDAVPVVRCKDCRFSDWYTAVDRKRRYYCMEHDSSGHEENDYCSYGKREDGDADGV